MKITFLLTLDHSSCLFENMILVLGIYKRFFKFCILLEIIQAFCLQDDRGQDVQSEKFQMNPNAEMFQSKMHSAFPVSDENPDGFSQQPQDDQQGDFGMDL